MLVTLLLVEGELDSQLLTPVLSGRPAVEATKGSKNALPPRTRNERNKGVAGVYYLRDRDFDYEPPEDSTLPVIDNVDHRNTIFGWRWCRHEIEIYFQKALSILSALFFYGFSAKT